MDAKDKRIEELEKKLEEAQSNNVASPCGYLDVWSDSSASLRREYTVEELLVMLEKAKANDGIVGIRSQFMEAPNKTNGTLASLQVFPSHVLDYDEDNKQKEALDTPTTYRTEQFSKNVGGVNCYLKPRKVAVNQ